MTGFSRWIGLATLLGAGWANAQTGPAVDRIGFPNDYATKMQKLYTFDRPDTNAALNNASIRTIYGNAPAASVDRGRQTNFPYGSILVMESWAALRAADGKVALDANGRFIKNPAAAPTVFVSKKDVGFGADYGVNRTGEWEYVAYRPDGTYQTTPPNSFACAACHKTMGPDNDWTARVADLYLREGSGAVPHVTMKAYKYFPEVIRVKIGSLVNFYNDDVIDHNVTNVDNFGSSGTLHGGGRSFTVKFSTPGTYDFYCTIHPGMKMSVIVEP